jgi:sortase (surface protein transpeptidase)
MGGRHRRRTATVALAVLARAGASWGAPAGEGAPGTSTTTSPTPTATPPPSPAPTSPQTALAPELPSAVYDPEAHRAATSVPSRLRIPDLGVAGADVVPVGVEPNGELEVPPANQVGWYRFGPRPGRPGPTVLAAHVAYGGRDGVFRRLASLRPGSLVTVVMSDGTELSYRAGDVRQHAKTALPADVFGGGGPERLVLITCGGTFDPATRSYDANVIVEAERVT